MLTIQARPDNIIKAGNFGKCGKMIIKPFSIPDHLKKKYEKYFFRFVQPALPGICWEWKGRIHNNYASMASPEGSSKWAHRVSYALFNGPIQAQMHIDHRCRNGACVNPAHLTQMTPTENYEAIRRRKRRNVRLAQEQAGQLILW